MPCLFPARNTAHFIQQLSIWLSHNGAILHSKPNMAITPSKRPAPRRKGCDKNLPDGSTAVSAPTTTDSQVGAPLGQPQRVPKPITTITSDQEANMADNMRVASSTPATGTPPGSGRGLTNQETGVNLIYICLPVTHLYIPPAAIVKMQRRTIERLKFETLQEKIRQESAYPLSQPVLPIVTEYRISSTRLILGLHCHPDEWRDVNRFVWHEIQVSTLTLHISYDLHF